jgi:hypothetical protein
MAQSRDTVSKNARKEKKNYPTGKIVRGRLVSRIGTGSNAMLIDKNCPMIPVQEGILSSKRSPFQKESHISSKQKRSSFFFFRITTVAPQNLDTKQYK